jgi:hypothetical protein
MQAPSDAQLRTPVPSREAYALSAWPRCVDQEAPTHNHHAIHTSAPLCQRACLEAGTSCCGRHSPFILRSAAALWPAGASTAAKRLAHRLVEA